MAVTRVAVLVALVGCGRVGFDETPRDDAAALDAAQPDAAQPDAGPAVCGDSVCEGTRGESCVACAADCNTTQAVCGNQVCDAGEDSATCLGDCGPAPWPTDWAQTEDAILAQINTRRAAGTACGATAAVPALVMNETLRAIAQNHAWDAAHHDYQHSGNPSRRCNGVSAFDLMTQAGFDAPQSWISHTGGATATAATGFWFNNASACAILMDPQWTQVGIGHAEAMVNGQLVVWNYVLLWDP